MVIVADGIARRFQFKFKTSKLARSPATRSSYISPEESIARFPSSLGRAEVPWRGNAERREDRPCRRDSRFGDSVELGVTEESLGDEQSDVVRAFFPSFSVLRKRTRPSYAENMKIITPDFSSRTSIVSIPLSFDSRPFSSEEDNLLRICFRDLSTSSRVDVFASARKANLLAKSNNSSGPSHTISSFSYFCFHDYPPRLPLPAESRHRGTRQSKNKKQVVHTQIGFYNCKVRLSLARLITRNWKICFSGLITIFLPICFWHFVSFCLLQVYENSNIGAGRRFSW